MFFDFWGIFLKSLLVVGYYFFGEFMKRLTHVFIDPSMQEKHFRVRGCLLFVGNRNGMVLCGVHGHL